MGLTSTYLVAHQLRTLERKGYLRRDPNRPRAVEDPRSRRGRLGPPSPHDVAGSDHAAGTDVRAGARPHRRRRADLAEEAVEDVFPLPKELVGEGSLFLLKVVGDSMVDAAICDGDWVVVRQQPNAENGDIVAAMIEAKPQ